MKKKGLWFILFSLIIISCNNFETINYPDSVSIPYSPEYHLAQTYNDCGPYTVMAVINSYPDYKVSIEKIKKEMTWRLNNNYTLPFGMESLLKKYGMKIKTDLLFGKNSQKKIDFLKSKLGKRCRIIILGKIKNTSILHYIVLLGYDRSHFFCYDSFQKKKAGLIYTIDTNGGQTGNRNYSEQELLEFWNKGGYAFFYRNYCLVVYGKKTVIK